MASSHASFTEGRSPYSLGNAEEFQKWVEEKQIFNLNISRFDVIGVMYHYLSFENIVEYEETNGIQPERPSLPKELKT